MRIHQQQVSAQVKNTDVHLIERQLLKPGFDATTQELEPIELSNIQGFGSGLICPSGFLLITRVLECSGTYSEYRKYNSAQQPPFRSWNGKIDMESLRAVGTLGIGDKADNLELLICDSFEPETSNFWLNIKKGPHLGEYSMVGMHRA